VKLKSNEVKIGPNRRARTKLPKQLVNSLLNDTANIHVENFILPKSLHLCMIMYEGVASIPREEEELPEELDMKMFSSMREGGAGGRRNAKGGQAALPGRVALPAK
jgi:hypothetical protein